MYRVIINIIYHRCISADVSDNLTFGSGTYKMCTVQPHIASSPPKTDLTKSNIDMKNDMI